MRLEKMKRKLEMGSDYEESPHYENKKYNFYEYASPKSNMTPKSGMSPNKSERSS